MQRRMIAVLVLGCLTAARADVKLAPIFGEGMVLQQGARVPVWGAAAAGEAVSVAFHGQEARTVADAQGAWRVDLARLEPGGPWPLTVTGANVLTLNSYVGDVWVCSGQSNMEYPVLGTSQWQEVAKDVTPTLRLSKGSGPWDEAAGNALLYFSGPGYYFGKALSDARKVPIGLISAAVGATVIEQWVPPDSLKPLGYPGGGDMFNLHIKPMLPFAIKGVAWYQGEFNVGRYAIYARELHILIDSWRAAYGRPDLAFLIVQLPRNGEAPDPAAPPNRWNEWALLREAQQKARDLPGTGMALFFADSDGMIHPPSKRPIGQRLALLARSVAYGEKPEATLRSPLLKQAVHQGATISLHFSAAANGLLTTGGAPIADLFLAWPDGQVQPAGAQIKRGDVEIDTSRREGLPDIYYAWRGYPLGNLANAAGLPVAPFRVESLHLTPSQCAGNILTLVANQSLDPKTGGLTASYRVAGAAVKQVELLPDGHSVRLTTDRQWAGGQPVSIAFPRWKGWDGQTPMPPLRFNILPGHYANDTLLDECLLGTVRTPVDLKTGLQEDVPGVKDLAPAAGDVWKVVHPNFDTGPRFLLNALIPAPPANQKASALAHFYVYSDAERKVQLWPETSSGIKLYLNGADLGFWVSKPGPAGYEHIFPDVQLRQGWNSLLMEVTLSGWSTFGIRIMNQHGGASEGVSYQADKPTV